MAPRRARQDQSLLHRRRRPCLCCRQTDAADPPSPSPPLPPPHAAASSSSPLRRGQRRRQGLSLPGPSESNLPSPGPSACPGGRLDGFLPLDVLRARLALLSLASSADRCAARGSGAGPSLRRVARAGARGFESRETQQPNLRFSECRALDVRPRRRGCGLCCCRAFALGCGCCLLLLRVPRPCRLLLLAAPGRAAGARGGLLDSGDGE